MDWEAPEGASEVEHEGPFLDVSTRTVRVWPQWMQRWSVVFSLGLVGMFAARVVGFARSNVSRQIVTVRQSPQEKRMPAQTAYEKAPSHPVTIDHFIHDSFPGVMYDYFRKWDPMFTGADIHEDPVNCAEPHPQIYFANKKVASWPLFHNRSATFPMATEYMNTADWERPDGKKQTVLGFAEMQWPYYHYLGDLNSTSPYLVISMNPYNYTPARNYKFVECGLLGWPGFPEFASHEYPLRIIVKDTHTGRQCEGWDTDHAWCNLETSWGTHPEFNNWRPTAMEVNAAVHMCSTKYQCDIQKADFAAEDGKAIPQVFLFRVLRRADGSALPAAGGAHPGTTPSLVLTTPEIKPIAATPSVLPLPTVAPPSTPCDTQCHFQGWSASCRVFVLWAANQRFQRSPSACADARNMTLALCPVCHSCITATGLTCAEEEQKRVQYGGAQPTYDNYYDKQCKEGCTYDSWTATCATRVNYYANHNFHRHKSPCMEAYGMVTTQCISCWACNIEEAMCELKAEQDGWGHGSEENDSIPLETYADGADLRG